MTTPSSTTLWCRPAGATATKIVLGTGLLDDLRALLDDAERAAPSGRYWLWDQTLQGLLSNDIMGRDAAGSPAGAAAAGHAVASGESLKTLNSSFDSIASKLGG